MQDETGIFEIKQKKRLMDIYDELQNYYIEHMVLEVNEKGDVHIKYAKYRKKSL
jgi:hypothetical protein